MFTVAGIDHIVLRTDKVEEMLDFYRDVLGCEIEHETSAEMGLTQLRAGNALIDIVAVNSKLGKMGGGPPSKSENNMDHFCLQLKPIGEDEIRQHLKSKGIIAGGFADRRGAQGIGKSIYIKDPEGNTIELRSQI